jgi:fusion and transport protein UGO1
MATSRGEPNPLRPYYIPPSISNLQDTPGATSAGTHGLGPRNGSASSYASSAREMFADIDYSDYMSDASPSTIESTRKTLDETLYRYISVLLSQPFDVAKTVLQVRRQDSQDGSDLTLRDGIIMSSGAQSRREDRPFSDVCYMHGVCGLCANSFIQYPSDDDSDPDEPAYFTSSAPSAHSYSRPRSRRQQDYDDRITPSPTPRSSPKSSHQLTLKKSDSIMEVISQEWTKEGAWGVWKGSNATFVYAFLLKAVESWSRGVFSALFNVPDAGVIGGLGAVTEVADSPYPWASLAVAVAASVATGLILAPLDLVRTK